MLKTNAISSIITQPTRCNWKTQTLIDHIYTNISTNPINPYVVQETVSDHFPVAAELIAAKPKGRRSDIKKKRLILHTDSEELYAKAAALFTELPTLTPDNFNDYFANFISKVIFLLENYSEVKYTTRRERKLQKRPFISKGILKSIRTKNKLYQRLIQAGKDRKDIQYIDQLKKKCKRYGYILRQVLRRAEDMHYKSLLNAARNDPKKTWNVIHTIMKKSKRTQQQLTGIKDQSGTELTNPTEIADALNNHFATVGKKITATLPTYKSPQKPANPNSTPNSIYLETTLAMRLTN